MDCPFCLSKCSGNAFKKQRKITFLTDLCALSLLLCVIFFRTVEELGVDREVISSELYSSALHYFFFTLDCVLKLESYIYGFVCFSTMLMQSIEHLFEDITISLFTIHTFMLVTTCFTFIFSFNLRIMISIFTHY